MNGNEIEALIKSLAFKVYTEYPDCEVDDLIAQGWLVVTEKMPEFDKSKSSMRTYMYHQIYGGLRDYVRFNVLKEQNMNGMRDHGEYHEPHSESPDAQVEAKLMLEHIIENEDGITRDVLRLLVNGYTQSEAARELGLSRSWVSECIKKVRDRYEDN